VTGKLITFEGSEGSGKSTQIELAQDYLESQGRDILFVREPGGVDISEQIRDLLLDVKNKDMGDECETLLYMAARAQLVKEVVIPALESGTIILCDRFLDSTIAYQGYGHGVSISEIKRLGQQATGRTQPKLTFLLDLDSRVGLKRARGRRRRGDRIESKSSAFHRRVRQGFKKLARSEPKRFRVIPAALSREAIQEKIRTEVDHFIR